MRSIAKKVFGSFFQKGKSIFLSVAFYTTLQSKYY